MLAKVHLAKACYDGVWLGVVLVGNIWCTTYIYEYSLEDKQIVDDWLSQTLSMSLIYLLWSPFFSEMDLALLLGVFSHFYISQVSCGNGHNIAMSREGDLYVWGRAFDQAGRDSWQRVNVWNDPIRRMWWKSV